MTVKPLPIAQLVEDLSIYPRHQVDDSHVASLVQALKAGALLPPPVADAKSKRIVDGWHRVRAFRRVVGPTGVIDVDLRPYKTEADLKVDAVELNASHGRRLDKADQVRAVLLLEEAGVPVERVAVALHITPERVETLRVRVAVAPQSVRTHSAVIAIHDDDGNDQQAVPLKRPFLHMAGKKMTRDQVSTHDAALGSSHLLQMRQLMNVLKFDMLNREDERLLDALQELHATIGAYLKAARTPARKAS